MKKQKFYIQPQAETVRVQTEYLLQVLSTEHKPTVQDEEEDEEYDEDAPFGF